MNRWFEFKINADFHDDEFFLKHTKCGWIKWLSGDESCCVALDMVMKHAQDHLDTCPGKPEA